MYPAQIRRVSRSVRVGRSGLVVRAPPLLADGPAPAFGRMQCRCGSPSCRVLASGLLCAVYENTYVFKQGGRLEVAGRPEDCFCMRPEASSLKAGANWKESSNGPRNESPFSDFRCVPAKSRGTVSNSFRRCGSGRCDCGVFGFGSVAPFLRGRRTRFRTGIGPARSKAVARYVRTDGKPQPVSASFEAGLVRQRKTRGDDRWR